MEFEQGIENLLEKRNELFRTGLDIKGKPLRIKEMFEIRAMVKVSSKYEKQGKMVQQKQGSKALASLLTFFHH